MLLDYYNALHTPKPKKCKVTVLPFRHLNVILKMTIVKAASEKKANQVIRLYYWKSESVASISRYNRPLRSRGTSAPANRTWSWSADLEEYRTAANWVSRSFTGPRKRIVSGERYRWSSLSRYGVAAKNNLHPTVRLSPTNVTMPKQRFHAKWIAML